MIKFITQWFGLDTMMKEEFEACRRPAEIAITKATLYFERRVKQKLGPAGGPRTGRVYIIRGIEHQASAPGEPPASFSGDLRKSITHTPVYWVGDNAQAEISVGAPYGRILEYGGVTSHGVRILARPYISATWLEEEEHIQSILDHAMRKHAIMGDIVIEEVEE